MGVWDFLLNVILGWIEIIWDHLKGFVVSLISSLVGWIGGFWSSLTKFLQYLNSIIDSALDYFATQVHSWINSAISSVSTWLTNTWSSLTSFTAWLTTNVWAFLNSSWSSFTGFLGWLGSVIDSALSYFSTQISGVIDAAVKSATDWINNLGKQWDDFTRSVGAAWDNVTKYITVEAGKVLDAAGKAIGAAIDTAVSNMRKWVEDFVGVFTEALAGDFFTGLQRGVEAPHHSPLDIERPTDNEIVQGLQRYMKQYRDDRDKKKVT